MKMKRLAAVLLVAAAISAEAQNAYDGNKFLDNWYVGLNFGGTTPVAHSAFWKNMRSTMGIELGKQVTPVLGIAFQGLTSINTTASKTAFDATNLSLLGKLNLNNLFCGYKGEPRLFEVEALAGMGWGHDYVNSTYGWDKNYLTGRFGASFNFNLGEDKAWTVSVKPNMVYRMDGSDAHKFNVNKAAFEFLVGGTYHFQGSNGKRYMAIQRPYDQNEVNSLNKEINDLRESAAQNEQRLIAENEQLQLQKEQLQKELAECQNTPAQTIVKNTHSQSLESVITFRQGKTSISADQLPNVERIATYMKNHPGSTVVIKGYASPEGSAEINARIALQRADAVKNTLINKYKISATRIQSEGQGVGNMFSEPDWNRVSIATLNEKE